MKTHEPKGFGTVILAVSKGHRYYLAPVIGGAALLLAASQGRGQSYTIDWWDASGGGSSTGGVYTLSGSAGQPDAGSLAGGQYMLNGGFWAMVARGPVPTTLPALTITLTATNTVLLTWPSVTSGFVLQQATDLQSQNWSDAGRNPADNGSISSILLPLNSATRFYRLKSLNSLVRSENSRPAPGKKIGVSPPW